MSHFPYTGSRSLSCIAPPVERKSYGQQRKNLRDPEISLERNRLSSLADIKKPYQYAQQSTTEKLKNFISHLRESDLLAWFQRYLQRTQAKFHHQFHIREKPTAYEKYKHRAEEEENYAACECYFQSQKYGSYGPVISQAPNASQSLIAAIKKLTFQYILMDNKCNRQILIQCLKERKGSQMKSPVALPPNNHVLKIKKSPRIEIPQVRQQINLKPDPKVDIETKKTDKKNEEVEVKMKEQLSHIFERISVLQQKIKRQKFMHQKLLEKEKISRIERKISKKQDRFILGEISSNAEDLRKQSKINYKKIQNIYSNIDSKANTPYSKNSIAHKSKPSNRLATVL